MRLFDQHFVEGQEEYGIEVVGQFRDVGDPDRFVWIRSFPSMEARTAALEGFYSGPVWKKHADEANATMVDFSNVLLLRPADEDAIFAHDRHRRARITDPERRGEAGFVVATLHSFARPLGEAQAFRSRFRAEVTPALAVTGTPVLAELVRGGEAVRAHRLRAGAEPEVLAGEILRALTEGELDWASLFLSDIEKRWVAKDPARHLYWYPDIGPTVILQLNTQHKPFDAPEVRKAVSLALDRPRILREALSDYAPPADATGLGESQKAWKDPALVQAAGWTRRDLAQADQMLDAAGLARGTDGIRVVPGGGPMRYELHVVDGWSDWVTAAGIIRQNLAEVGVDAAVKPLAYDAWYGALERGRFDMGMWFGERGPTPYQFYRSQLDPTLVKPLGEKATANFHRFGSEEAGRLLRRFEASSDTAEQTQVGRALQVLVEVKPR